MPAEALCVGGCIFGTGAVVFIVANSWVNKRSEARVKNQRIGVVVLFLGGLMLVAGSSLGGLQILQRLLTQ
jgi:multisubunit Na+/H+ antiporter MnhB subunit